MGHDDGSGRGKKIVVVAVVIMVAVAAVIAMATVPGALEGGGGDGGSTGSSTGRDHTVVFHATLADPDMYTGGIHTDTFAAEQAGLYSLRFVPNGSSPGVLSISLDGPSLQFSEDFVLEGTLQQTPISEYYTWEYAGQDIVEIPAAQQVTVTIDPNGSTRGSVSVDILLTGQ